MKISKNCINLVKHYEGLYLNAYRCPGGIMTIGYGTTLYPNDEAIKEGDTCTIEQAEMWLANDLSQAERFVNLQNINLTQNQFDAVLSFVYNLGPSQFLHSTLYRKIKVTPDDDSIADEFIKWHHAAGKDLKGLKFRRMTEAHLYYTGILKFEWE